MLWKRLVAHPDTASGKRGAAGRPLPALRIPGLGKAASAVAWAQVRGSWRTIQGRLALAIPALTLLIMTFVFRRPEVREHLFGLAAGGPILVLVAIFLALVGQQAVVLNQFAVDGTGLSLEFLGPLSDRDLLRGKAAGGAILTACSLVPALLAAAVLGGGSSPWLWPAALLVCLGSYAVMSPIAACLSILLPKAVDLRRLGSKGKPNQGAALIAMLILPFTLAPAVGLAALALLVWKSPGLLLALEAAWLVFGCAVAWWFLLVCEGFLVQRREAIFLTVNDRE